MILYFKKVFFPQRGVITMEITWLFGGFDSAQPPSYNGAIIPAEAGICKFSFSVAHSLSSAKNFSPQMRH